MNTKVIIASLFFILIFSFTYGQNNFSTENEINKLSFKLGKWKWKTRGYVPNEKGPQNGIGYSHVYFINDSTSLIDDHLIEWENGFVYRAITYRTYDKQNNSYMVVWAQAETGHTLQIEGRWEENKFIEINKGKNEFGNWTNRLEINDIQENFHKAKLVRTYENGYKITILEYEAFRIN